MNSITKLSIEKNLCVRRFLSDYHSLLTDEARRVSLSTFLNLISIWFSKRELSYVDSMYGFYDLLGSLDRPLSSDKEC